MEDCLWSLSPFLKSDVGFCGPLAQCVYALPRQHSVQNDSSFVAPSCAGLLCARLSAIHGPGMGATTIAKALLKTGAPYERSRVVSPLCAKVSISFPASRRATLSEHHARRSRFAGWPAQPAIDAQRECLEWTPTSRPSDDVSNGSGARESPVAPALRIRLELAQDTPLRMPGRRWRLAWLVWRRAPRRQRGRLDTDHRGRSRMDRNCVGENTWGGRVFAASDLLSIRVDDAQMGQNLRNFKPNMLLLRTSPGAQHLTRARSSDCLRTSGAT